MFSDAAQGDVGCRARLAPDAAAGPVAAVDEILFATLEYPMFGNHHALVEDTNLVGHLLDLDHPAGSVRNAVVIAADGDESVMADPSFELENCPVGVVG